MLFWEERDDADGALDVAWRSGDAVCLAVGLLHPAVLVRYMRLCIAVRLARRAPRKCWEALFVARFAKRSWREAVLEDLRWLKRKRQHF